MGLKNLFFGGKRIARLYREKVQLAATMLIVNLLSKIVLGAVGIICAAFALFFLSIGFGLMLAEMMDPMWAFAIVAAIYVAVMAVIFIFSKQLVYNKISLIVSKIVITAPDDDVKVKIDEEDEIVTEVPGN